MIFLWFLFVELIFFYPTVEKITEGISYVAKQSVPAAVASIQSVRKAMGISVETPTLSVQSGGVEPIQRDLESELSKLLGEDDGVPDVMTGIFQ